MSPFLHDNVLKNSFLIYLDLTIFLQLRVTIKSVTYGRISDRILRIDDSGATSVK